METVGGPQKKKGWVSGTLGDTRPPWKFKKKRWGTEYGSKKKKAGGGKTQKGGEAFIPDVIHPGMVEKRLPESWSARNSWGAAGGLKKRGSSFLKTKRRG